MKKLTITSILALSIACSAFADITTSNNDPKCDNTTIGAYQGSTELEAQWTANTINLKWYDADGEIEMASNAPAATCTYADDITLPTPPTRPGYTFNQWVVRPSGFNLATLASSISTNGSAYAYILNNGQSSKYKASSTYTVNTPDAYGLTTAGEWAAEFGYGTVKGIARCSLVGEGKTIGDTGSPTDDLDLNDLQNGAQYCWCQASGFDAEKDGTYLNVSSPSWVFLMTWGLATGCARKCASECTYYVTLGRPVRSAVFGVQ